MNDQYYLKSLKRIYDEADKIQEREDYLSVDGVLRTYNELLPELREDYPENGLIQRLDEVKILKSARGTKTSNVKEMQKVKMNVLRIADSLGGEVEDFERKASTDGMTVIHVNQSVQQSVDVSIEGVMQIINNLPREDNVKEELRDLVETYQREMQSENPDTSLMLELIKEAREYSKDVATKLVIVGLNKGIDLLTGLAR